MNLLEGYAQLLSAIERLRATEIPVELVPTKGQSKPSVREELPLDKWLRVAFSPRSEIDLDMIYDEARKLGEAGIYFDTGGGGGERHWEIDWSFRVKGGSDVAKDDAREQVETLIRGLEGTTSSELVS